MSDIRFRTLNCLPSNFHGSYSVLLGQHTAGRQKKQFKERLKPTLKRCQINPSSLGELAFSCTLWHSHSSQEAENVDNQRTKHVQRNVPRGMLAKLPLPPQVLLLHAWSVTATVDPGSDLAATQGRRHQIRWTTRTNKSVCVCVCVFAKPESHETVLYLQTHVLVTTKVCFMHKCPSGLLLYAFKQQESPH